MTNDAKEFLKMWYSKYQIEYYFVFKGQPSRNWIYAKIGGCDNFVFLSIIDGCGSGYFGNESHLKKLRMQLNKPFEIEKITGNFF